MLVQPPNYCPLVDMLRKKISQRGTQAGCKRRQGLAIYVGWLLH